MHGRSFAGTFEPSNPYQIDVHVVIPKLKDAMQRPWKDASVDLHLSSDRVVAGPDKKQAHLEENCNRRWSSRSSCSRRKYKRLREPQRYCHGPDGPGRSDWIWLRS